MSPKTKSINKLAKNKRKNQKIEKNRKKKKKLEKEKNPSNRETISFDEIFSNDLMKKYIKKRCPNIKIIDEGALLYIKKMFAKLLLENVKFSLMFRSPYRQTFGFEKNLIFKKS